jgi:RNA polymerase sigma factor (sigma-70 family)
MPPVLPYRRTRPAASNFEDLLRPQIEYLYQLAWRFTGGVADAEDLVQDLLVKLYPRIDELLDIEQLRPWLARVLYRQYVDSVRKRARSPIARLVGGTEEDDDSLDAFPSMTDGPEEQAERHSLRERLLHALSRLSPEQRAVVTMHDVEGYSLEELESILETPLGTLKSRLHRARNRLRALLPMEPFEAGQRVSNQELT